MKRVLCRWLLSAAVLTGMGATAALADSPFILPSTTSLAGTNNVVTFDAAGSDHVFYMDHRPIQLASITVTKPDGTAAEPYNTVQGRFRSVFDLKIDQEGTWKISSGQSQVSGTFMLDGLERRVGGRGGPPRMPGEPGAPGVGMAGAGGPGQGGPGQGGPGGPGNGERRLPPVALQDIPANATDIHLTENISRTETFVTAGAPTDGVFKPTGKGLEFDPITHPNSVAAGEVARFRFLVDGKPAAGIKVTVIAGGDRYRDDTGAVELITGADGVVSINWPTAGMYWIGATAEDRHPGEKRAETRKMSYAATLEVMTP